MVSIMTPLERTVWGKAPVLIQCPDLKVLKNDLIGHFTFPSIFGDTPVLFQVVGLRTRQPRCVTDDKIPLINVLFMLAGTEKRNIHCHPTICSILYMAILLILCVWLRFKYSPSLWQYSAYPELITCRYFWSMSHYQIKTTTTKE